jgi:hypothetical protein
VRRVFSLQRHGHPLQTTVRTLASALLAPWTLPRRVADVPTAWLAVAAAVSIAIAAAMSVTLSSWTYMAGKGLLLATHNEMDLGQDDLPPDSLAQVAAGFIGSFGVWAVLLAIALLICVGAADAIYRDDRSSLRIAIRGAFAASVWFIVWALFVVAANSIREGEVAHPAAAIRAYAQLNQQGFRGSSAMSPGPPERQPLAGAGRLLPLAVAFPIIWALALPPARVLRRAPARWFAMAAAVGLSWVAWWAVWRLLPWIKIGALAG